MMEITSDLLQRGGGEHVVIVDAERFAHLLAQVGQLLQTLLHLLLSLGNILGHGSFVLPDAGRALRLVELHLRRRERRFTQKQPEQPEQPFLVPLHSPACVQTARWWPWAQQKYNTQLGR